jgi:hypothetical protein
VIKYANISGREDYYRVFVREAALKQLIPALTATYLKALDDVRSEMPEEYHHKNNPNHEKDEYWGCCECNEDQQKNTVLSATISAITKLKQDAK